VKALEGDGSKKKKESAKGRSMVLRGRSKSR
jgi:hypothetical protein